MEWCILEDKDEIREVLDLFIAEYPHCNKDYAHSIIPYCKMITDKKTWHIMFMIEKNIWNKQELCVQSIILLKNSKTYVRSIIRILEYYAKGKCDFISIGSEIDDKFLTVLGKMGYRNFILRKEI